MAEGSTMLQVHRRTDSGVTLRLLHDLSPDSDDSCSGDEESEAIRRETFLISCLAQSAINNNNNNSIRHVSQTTCDRACRASRTASTNSTSTAPAFSTCGRTDSITDAYTKTEWKQNHFERINNHINEQHLYKLLDGQCNNINRVNNNYLQNAEYEQDSSDKENVRPCSPAHVSGGEKAARRPRKLPDLPKKQTQAPVLRPRAVNNEKCLADELQEALTQSTSDDDDVFCQTTVKQNPKVYPKYSCKYIEELTRVKFNSVSKNTRAYLNSDNMYLKEDSTEGSDQHESHERARESEDPVPREKELITCGQRGSDEDGEESRQYDTCFPGKNYKDLVVTHRGMHRFIPRHKDEVAIEIGDPIHVVTTGDDLWCEGINLRSCQRGIFPSMYATDLGFLEEEEEGNGCSKFFLRFLGSVEVNYHKGDEVLCQAINKVALSRRSIQTSLPPPICTVEISQYGVRMLDKSTSGHENLKDAYTHFFALKNITFCGHHPRNERYFGFITKHPNQYRYACHVFLGEKSTRSVSDSMGQAFKRFYQEYMAFTHPTEDIYME